MKKAFLLVSLPVIAAGLCLAVNNNSPMAVFAEGEEPEVVEPAPEVETTEEETEEKKALDTVKSWLSQHFDTQMVANIITWASEAGILGALLGVYIKYRRYKAKSLDELLDLFKKEIDKYFKDNFEKLSEEKLTGLVNALKDVENANETIMKVLVLMQDSTRKGRIALLDFLGSKTNNEEVKEAAEQLSEDLEEQEAKDEEVKDAVAGDYERIF